MLNWPPQSTYVIPLEHLWDAVGWDVPTKVSEERLVESTPQRINVVLKAKGNPT